ncbi:MAG: ABC transporter permease, partial [Deltaproteobacteria bacterium]|nr:ABC transporter permease [Deltaproteobacteria bacterium]
MNLFMTFRVAVRALFRNKLRSFLTTLGIIIGVGAVIAMVAIGEGAKSRVEATFAAMGTNLLIVMPGSSNQGGARGGFGSQPTLTFDDLKAIQTEVSTVRAAAPVLRTTAQVQSGDDNWSTSIQGTTPDYAIVRNWGVDEGVGLSSSDVESGAKVAVLGATVADQLFGGGDPVGQLVRIKGVPFQVVGVLSKKGQSGMGQDYDDTVLVPVTTFKQRIVPSLGNFLSGTIFVAARSAADTDRAQKQITTLLRDRHRTADNADSDFSIRNLQEIAAGQQESTQTLTLLLVSIALVSLAVGGIGIMNIMLVSVTERTR